MTFVSAHSDVLMIAGYAIFLLLVARGFEIAARVSQKKLKGLRNLRFRFHAHLNAWECPEGAYLVLQEIDYESRVARYQAPAHRCNSCALRSVCTDSNDGRVLLQSIEEWPRTEMGKFQLAIAVTLMVVCALMLAIASTLYRSPSDLGILGTTFAVVAAAGIRFVRKFSGGHPA